MSETSWHRCQRPNHVKTPTCERLGRWYSDEVVCRDVSLFAKELTVVTPVDEFFGVCQSHQPVDTWPECLPD
jgi:hypothetical protein